MLEFGQDNTFKKQVCNAKTCNKVQKSISKTKSDCFMLFRKVAPYGYYDGKAILMEATVKEIAKQYELRNETFIPFTTEAPTGNEDDN